MTDNIFRDAKKNEVYLMGPQKEKRIGIFEYDWSMYSFIRDLVIKLAEAGYTVDFFQKNPSVNRDFANSEQFRNYKNIRYFSFDTSSALTQKFLRKFKGLLRRLNPNYRYNPKSFMDDEILARSRKIVNESKYLCFIGIEKQGLIWAGILSKIHQCPLIYYSLELYIEDHPDIKSYSYLRKAEKEYHQLAAATIIQDKLRAKALIEYNEVENTNLIYFPISARGDIVENKSEFLYQKNNIDKNKKLILYFGLIQKERFSTDLIRIASRLKDDIVLVLHGYGEQAYLADLQSKADKDRVSFSLDFVTEEKITDVISSVAIGLALYATTNSNDRLVTFSSVKVAYYLQCGIPIIAFDTESFRELMNAYKCGELISSIEEIPQKVEEILKDYDFYKRQAFMAFRAYYDFDKNFEKFKIDFENVIDDSKEKE